MFGVGMPSLIKHFCELTGCDAHTARSFLEANDGDLQVAVNRFFAGSSRQSRDRSAVSGNHDPTSDVNYSAPSTSSSGRGTRDHPPEVLSPSDQKRFTLEKLFSHPYELMHAGNLRQAMEAGRFRRKWILVSLYDDACFDCRVLNRDVWKDYRIINLIKRDVIFLQFGTKSSDGMLYRNRFTCIDSATHIAFLNPFTGEQKIFWNHLKTPYEVFGVLSRFLLVNPTPGSTSAICDTATSSAIAATTPDSRPRPSPDETGLLSSSGPDPEYSNLKARNLKAANNSSAMPSSHVTVMNASLEAPIIGPSTSSTFPTTSKHSSSLKRGNLDTCFESGPSKRPLMEDDADSLRFIDLALEEEDEDIDDLYAEADSSVETDEEAAELMRELPPLTDPANAFRIALRFPCGKRTVLNLEPSLSLQSLFSFFKAQGYSPSKFELIRVYPRLRLNDLPPTSRIDETGLAKSDSLFLQDI